MVSNKGQFKKINNVSNGLENFSQRNNEVKPLESCNTTSYTMATSYIDKLWEIFKNSKIYKKYSIKYKQEEDCLQKYALDIGLNPTVHADLCKAYNNFMNGGTEKELGSEYKTYAIFRDNVPIISILNEIECGRPVVLSGTFPGFPTAKKTPLGHIVTLVGDAWNPSSDINNHPDYLIIDDPYGNTVNDWKGSGNDVFITWAQFIEWFKPVGGETVKWAHMFIA